MPKGVYAPRMVTIPNNSEAVAIVEGTRRKLADLPLMPKAMHPVAVICMYTMFGLTTQDIAIATGISEHQVASIRMSGEYASIQKAVVQTVLECEMEDAKDYLNQQRLLAARKMVELVDSPDQRVAVKAAADVMDRTGMRPVDIMEVHHRMAADLRIVVLEQQPDDPSRPVIDLEVEK